MGQRKALAHSSQAEAGALVAGVLDLLVLVVLEVRLNVLAVVLVDFVVVRVRVVRQLGLGRVDGFRPRSSTRRGQILSRSMKRRKLCGQRKGNLCGRCEGGLEPSCSSRDGPTLAPGVLAVIRSARIYVAAVAPVAPRPLRPRPCSRHDGDGDDDGDDEATASP